MSMEEHMVEAESVLSEHGANDGVEDVADDQTTKESKD